MDAKVNKGFSLLTDQSLCREAVLAGGRWIQTDANNCIKVNNPASGELLGIVPNLGEQTTSECIGTAADAFKKWREVPVQDRSVLLMAWHDLMLANREDLAIIMTLEQGKPITESRGEIDYAASFIKWFAEQACRVNVESVTPHLPGRQIFVKREPIGVTAAITPWNFPSAMITRKAAAAIAAGCTMIVRPASETPFSAIALAVLAQRAGLPDGVLSVITGKAGPIADTLCHDNRVRAMSFTGSTEVGRRLLANASLTIKHMVMELGGHAPFIVFDDVDIDKAVDGAIAAKFTTTGQDCLAASRIFVHDKIYDEFCERFAKRAKALIVAHGLDEASQIGPLMNERAFAKCREHVTSAVAGGARLLAGGNSHSLGGLFFEPAVLGDVTDTMLISREETFGPVAALMRFNSEQEVVDRSNNSIYGLASYIWSNDLSRVHRIADQLEYGMVAVNCVKMTGPPVPFGGVKQSGLGREGSRHGLEAFTEIKYICMNIANAI